MKVKLDFFKSGVIRAVLRATGINAVSREQFTRPAMMGRRTCRLNLAGLENSGYVRGRNSFKGC